MGEGKSYYGGGGGAVGGLHQITKFPYSSYDFNITDMNNDVVTVDYHGQNFTLKPGDSWTNRTEEILPEFRNYALTRDATIDNHGRLELVIEGSPVPEQCRGIWC